MQIVVSRLKVWKETFWSRWVIVAVAVFGFASNADTVLGWFNIQSRFGVAALSSKISSETWYVLLLLLIIVVLLESLYHAITQRDDALKEVKTERRNQELSDLMSDQHEYAVHELLAKPPVESALSTWMEREKIWRDNTLRIMQDFECTKQERRHVNTLGLVPMIFASPNPAIAHQLSMLVTRMGRIADIAGRYSEEGPPFVRGEPSAIPRRPRKTTA